MLSDNNDGKSPTFFGILLLKDTSIKFSRLQKDSFLQNKHISLQQTQMVRAFFGMSKLLFAVLVVLCLSVGALATTTKPPLQQKTDASKDLCEVSTNAQQFTQLAVTWVTTLKKTCFRIEGKFLREYEDIGTNSNQEIREIYSN